MNHTTDIVTSQIVHDNGEENSLADYLIVLRRHLWLIVISGVGVAIAAAVWSYLQTPIYQAKATVVIELEGPGTLEKEYYRQDVSPEYFQTHFELMRSHQVLQRTAQLLHLSQRPEYQRQSSALKKAIYTLLPAAMLEFWKSKKDTSKVSLEEREDNLLQRFSEQIDIMPVRGARLAHITVNSEDPEFAAQAANTLASVYIDTKLELSSKTKEKAAQWFTTHLDELRNKVEASEQDLYLFRSKHGLLQGHERQTVAAQKLTELNSELVKAEMKKADTQTRHQQIASLLRNRPEGDAIDWSSLDASTEVLSSPLIQLLRAQEIRVSGQVAELSDKYGPLHPKLARAKTELQDLHERIQQEVQKIYDSVKREYEAAIARERAIKEAVSRNNQEKIKLEQYEIEHGILEREAQSNQHLYDIFLKVMKEVDLSSGMKASNVYLADPAVPSSIPVKPKKKLNTLLGLMVGLMTGAGLTYVLESRDRSLKKPDDVERYLPSISLLGVVPLLTKKDASDGTLFLSTNRLSPAAESFRTIRTSLLLSRAGQLPSCVLITSPGESEGKTTLAVNLATAMAQLEDTPVILINADLRKSYSHHIFDVLNGTGTPKGLVHYLSGAASPRDIIHQTEVPNLSVVPRGDYPSNPSELLHSKRMRQLLKWYCEEGFHVIVDAPPVLVVTDPVVLSTQVEGVLLVVSAGETTREACRSAVQRLTTSGGKFLGIVMQKTPMTDMSYYSKRYVKKDTLPV
jgi:polysaccharide biosynthesis transport protein